VTSTTDTRTERNEQGPNGAFVADAASVPLAVTHLLSGVRRRLRLAWALATIGWIAPFVALGAVVLVGVARIRPWRWPEPGALVLVAAALVAVAVLAATLRISALVSARAADRGLVTRDAFATAIEVDDGVVVAGPFAEPILVRAGDLAAGRKPSDAIRLHLPGRRLAVAAAVGALALVVALLPNHQDALRAERAAERAALATQATELRKTADLVGRQPTGANAADRLRVLADALDKAQRLSNGSSEIDKAVADLQTSISPNLLGQKAAALGIERSVKANPLTKSPIAGEGASAQLQGAAAQAAEMSEAERAALAQRLDNLANAQRNANPELSKSLEAAASALRSGDKTAAQKALNDAAALQTGRLDTLAGQQAAAAASQAAANAKANLDAQRAGQGQQGQSQQGQGQQGQGQAGQGQSGQGQQGQGSQGQGQGKGQGQGSGQGQGQGSGSPSGKVGGTNAATGSGQGGQGRPNGSGNNASVGIQSDPKIFDPAFTNGDQLLGDPLANGGPGEVQGKVAGANQAGGVVTPLAEALPRYAAQATDALDTLSIPPSLRDLVRAYFDQLAEKQR